MKAKNNYFDFNFSFMKKMIFITIILHLSPIKLSKSIFNKQNKKLNNLKFNKRTKILWIPMFLYKKYI